MSYLKKGMQGIAIVFILGILTNLLGYSTRAILARVLSPSDYGLFYAVFSLIMFLTLFANFGMSNAIVKYVSELIAREKKSEVKFLITYSTLINIIVSIFLSILLFLISDFLAINYFGVPESKFLIIIFSFILPFIILNSVFSNIFNSFKNVLLMSLTNFISSILFLLSFIILLILGIKKNSILPGFAYFIGIFISVIIFFIIYILRFYDYKTPIKKYPKLLKEVIIFAVISFPIGVSHLIINQADTLMLTYFDSLSNVGIYNAVLPTVMVLAFFSKSSFKVFMPLVSEFWAKKDYLRLQTSIKIMIKYMLLLIMPFVLILFGFSEIIIRLLFGYQYISGDITMKILSIGIIFLSLNIIYQSILVGIGFAKDVTKVLIIGALFNIILNLILIPLIGMVGAAISTALSYFIIFILINLKANKRLKIIINYWWMIKLFLCSLLFLLVNYIIKKILYLNQFLEASICLIVSFIIYFILAYILNVIDINELRFFISKAIVK